MKSVSGKNQKDMASYKFWQTQPVPRFGERRKPVASNLLTMVDEVQQIEEGPIKIIDPEIVPKEPPPMYEGFEWVTMNLMDSKEVSSFPLSAVNGVSCSSSWKMCMSSYRITMWKMMKPCFDSIIRSLFSTGMSAGEFIFVRARLIVLQGLLSRPDGAKNGMSVFGPPNHAN